MSRRLAVRAARGYGSLLRRRTTAEMLPALHRAIESGSLDDDDNLGTEFHFGLNRILDGVGTEA